MELDGVVGSASTSKLTVRPQGKVMNAFSRLKLIITFAIRPVLFLSCASSLVTCL